MAVGLRVTLRTACVWRFVSFCFVLAFGFFCMRSLEVLATRSASQHGRFSPYMLGFFL